MTIKPGKAIHRYFLLHTPFYQTSVDKEMKWVPFAVVGLLKIFGVKTRSGWMKTILIAGATESIRYLITDSLKKITSNHRPFPYTGHDSFPSGDTSSSFSGAEFMHRELKNSLGFFSCAGYFGGAATGAIRLMKNRHWLKDVIAGAVIGIVSAKLAFFLISKFEKSKKKKEQNNENGKMDHETIELMSEKIKSPAT